MEFQKIVEQALVESNVAGGVSSAFGSNVGSTSTVNSGDNYAKDNGAIIPKSLYGGVITRRGMSKKAKKKKK